MLKEVFITLIQKYSNDSALGEKLWHDIEKKYSGRKRHYHNLSHLENLYQQLSEVKEEITDWDALLFALYYHDIIYSATSKKNEEESAVHAQSVLQHISFPKKQTDKCVEVILATKAHIHASDHDTNLLPTQTCLC